MKVWELIAELSKYPAGYDIEVEMVEEDYTVNTIKEKGSPPNIRSECRLREYRELFSR